MQGKTMMISTTILAGYVGNTLCWVWFFILIGAPFFTPDKALGTAGAHCALNCSLIVVGIVTVLFTQKFFSFWTRFTKACLFFFSVSPLIVLAGTLLPIGFWFLTSYVAGFCYSLAYIQWPRFMKDISNGRIKLFLIICMGSAGSVGILLLAFKDWLVPFAVLFIPAIASLCLYYAIGKNNSECKEIRKEKDPVPVKVKLCVAGNSLVLSYVLMVLRLQDTSSWKIERLLPVLVLIVALCIFFYLDYRKDLLFHESSIIKLLLGVCVFLVIPSGFVPQPASTAFLCLALALLLVTRVQSLSSMYGNVFQYRLDPVHCFVSERLFAMCGLLLGFLIYWICIESDVNTAFATFFVGSIAVVGTILTGFQTHAPVDEKKAAEGDPFALSQYTDEPHRREWMALCEKFQKRYNLSEREKEVMYFYSKGFPAESIASELFISASTVRSHVYNIYHKASVHSRHELNARIIELRKI